MGEIIVYEHLFCEGIRKCNEETSNTVHSTTRSVVSNNINHMFSLFSRAKIRSVTMPMKIFMTKQFRDRMTLTEIISQIIL